MTASRVSCSVELLVSLKTGDTTASTALDTLKTEMGYGGRLIELGREDYWKADLMVRGEAEALELGLALATQTKLFVNPTKHEYRLRLPGRLKETQPGGTTYSVEVLTWYLEGSCNNLVREAKRVLGSAGEQLEGLSRGVLWTLDLETADRDTALSLAREITESRGAGVGLLANLHSQGYRVC